ncbi:MAG: ribose 5-phosphate isomerase B [Dehalococcoidia bacterium]
MKVAIGSDHRGFHLKQAMAELLRDMGLEYHDFGCYDTSSVDYPDVAQQVAREVQRGEFDHGVLICGTGIGMSIAANKMPGIRAAPCYNPFSARMAREHNNANILCLGGELLGPELAQEIARAYFSSSFQGGRHQRRIEKLSHLEEQGAAEPASEGR